VCPCFAGLARQQVSDERPPAAKGSTGAERAEQEPLLAAAAPKPGAKLAPLRPAATNGSCSHETVSLVTRAEEAPDVAGGAGPSWPSSRQAKAPPVLDESEASSDDEDSGPWTNTTMAELGPDGLPSVGSGGHRKGDCKRCCFHPKGRCQNGHDCRFCHYDHDKRKRLKKKSKRDSENPTPSSTAGSKFSAGLASNLVMPSGGNYLGGSIPTSMMYMGRQSLTPTAQHQSFPLSPSAPPTAPPVVASFRVHEPPPPPSEAPEVSASLRPLPEEQVARALSSTAAAPVEAADAGPVAPRSCRPVTINDMLGEAAVPSWAPQHSPVLSAMQDHSQIPFWPPPAQLPGLHPGGVPGAWPMGYWGSPCAPVPQPQMAPQPAPPYGWPYGGYGAGLTPEATVAASLAASGACDGMTEGALLLPEYTSSTMPYTASAASRPAAAQPGVTGPAPESGGNSPRSVILALTGAWAALGTRSDAGSHADFSGAPSDPSARPFSRQELLDYRRSAQLAASNGARGGAHASGFNRADAAALHQLPNALPPAR